MNVDCSTMNVTGPVFAAGVGRVLPAPPLLLPVRPKSRPGGRTACYNRRMSDTLRDLVRCHSERHADAAGVSHTPIAGLRTIRAARPSALEHAISRPLACLVLQGTKRVTTGNRTVTFGAGESLLITADVPTVSQILEASSTTPYMSLVFDLNLATLAELAMEMKASQVGSGDPVQTEPTDRDVADAAARLMQLLNRPAALEILQAQLVREMHYWLLAGKHGPTIAA